MRMYRSVGIVAIGLAAMTLNLACGPPTDPSIVYKKLTPREFAALSPEDRELPEVMENMGDAWRDPSLPENTLNPKR